MGYTLIHTPVSLKLPLSEYFETENRLGSGRGQQDFHTCFPELFEWGDGGVSLV